VRPGWRATVQDDGSLLAVREGPPAREASWEEPV
jgi:hypothetical protein